MDPGAGRAEDRAQQQEGRAICNLYNVTSTQEAMIRLVEGLTDRAGNVAPGSVYPDQLAPIIRHGEDGPELVKARWGMPSPPSVLKTARDPGVTNVRNLSSPHWHRWLARDHRCLVPVTSFSEPRGKRQGVQWFAPTDAETTMFFAGIETRGWTSLRKVKDGETVDDLFAFLTCSPNAEVGRIHPKAMPVILTRPDEWRAWLDGIRAEELQRPLPDGALALVDGPL
ncbi:SOS response-associated peptidase [Paracoccus aestuarii]